MKNYLKMTFIAAMAIPMLLLLSSCDKNEEQKDETTYKGSFKLSYNVYDDFLAVANIEVSYYDESGVLRSEPITNAEWKKEIKYKNLPTNAGFKITCTVKNPLPQNNKFNLKYQYSGNVSLLKEKSNEIVSSRYLNKEFALQGVSAENMERVLETFEVTEFYQIKDGKVTVLD